MSLQVEASVTDNGCMTERFLSISEIGALWGISRPGAAKWFADVEPDARIGEVGGWKMETVDAVNAKRKAGPGRGNWGPRETPESE